MLLPIALTSTGCSSTSKLPEGEILYAGVKSIDFTSVDTVMPSVLANVKSTLEVAPNSSFLGSAYHMSPLPFGLWFYNKLYTTKDKGLKYWLWNKLKSDPTLISQVNPEIRARAAEIKMEEEGYFNGIVRFDTIFDKKNNKKAKIAYNVTFPHRKVISSIYNIPTRNSNVDSIISHTSNYSFLKVGDRFSTENIEKEIDRIVKVMRDSGYFFYDDQLIKILADSTQEANSVALRILHDAEAEEKQLKPCRLDSVEYTLDWGAGLKKANHDSIGFMRIDYNSVLNVKPKRLLDAVTVGKGELYNPDRLILAKNKLDRLNIFKYTQTGFKLLDSNDQVQDTIPLLFAINSTYNFPWQGTLEANAKYKDNHQMGPGISLVAQKRNCFRGGELFQGEVNASYEWATGNRTIGNKGMFNSYEFGYKFSLIVPRLQIPNSITPDFDNPVNTRYSISTDIMRRAGFFNLLKATGEVSYTFYTGKTSQHIFTPFKLSYSSMLSTTERFDSVISSNRVLEQSFANQFVPQIGYTFIYDNSPFNNGIGSSQYLQVSFNEAGALFDALMGKWGKHKVQGERQLFGQRFSQFIKLTADFRNYLTFKENFVLATRLYGGIVYSYGNSRVAPYSEQFYIGGANSLRGFSIRSIGPGKYRPSENKYSYMDQTGDIKLEANVEFRFPISGDLRGALFADAGNIWTARKEEQREGGKFEGKNFGKQLATDAGFGLRYDLGMLVVRFDLGVPIHDPCGDDNKYYNPSGTFFGNLGYHLAIGYPF